MKSILVLHFLIISIVFSLAFAVPVKDQTPVGHKRVRRAFRCFHDICKGHKIDNNTNTVHPFTPTPLEVAYAALRDENEIDDSGSGEEGGPTLTEFPIDSSTSGASVEQSGEFTTEKSQDDFTTEKIEDESEYTTMLPEMDEDIGNGNEGEIDNPDENSQDQDVSPISITTAASGPNLDSVLNDEGNVDKDKENVTPPPDTEAVGSVEVVTINDSEKMGGEEEPIKMPLKIEQEGENAEKFFPRDEKKVDEFQISHVEGSMGPGEEGLEKLVEERNTELIENDVSVSDLKNDSRNSINKADVAVEQEQGPTVTDDEKEHTDENNNQIENFKDLEPVPNEEDAKEHPVSHPNATIIPESEKARESSEINAVHLKDNQVIEEAIHTDEIIESEHTTDSDIFIDLENLLI